MHPDKSGSTSQHLLCRARKQPDAEDVIDGDHAWSYGDLALCVAQYATALRLSGGRAGMRVGLVCEHRYLHLALVLPCDVLATTSVLLSVTDVAAGSDGAEHCDFLCLFGDLANVVPGVTHIHLTQDVIDRIGRVQTRVALFGMLDVRRPADSVVRPTRTSGSTGRAKVMRSTRVIWSV